MSDRSTTTGTSDFTRSGGKPATRRCYTVGGVADELQISTRSVWRLISSGKLATVKLGRLTRIPVEALEDLLAAGAAEGGK